MKKKETIEYLDKLIEQATPKWKGIDVDKWLNELRGNYDLKSPEHSRQSHSE